MLKVTNITSASSRTSSRLSIDDDEIEGLPLLQLCGLVDAVTTIRDVALGLINQPKFESDDDESGHNAAGQMIERMLGFLDGLETSIIEVIRTKNCSDSHDINRKYAALLTYGACLDSMADLNFITAQALLDHNELRYRKKREAAA